MRSQIYKYWSIHYGASYGVGALKGEWDVFLPGRPLSGLAVKPFCQCSSYIEHNDCLLDTSIDGTAVWRYLDRAQWQGFPVRILQVLNTGTFVRQYRIQTPRRLRDYGLLLRFTVFLS